MSGIALVLGLRLVGLLPEASWLRHQVGCLVPLVHPLVLLVPLVVYLVGALSLP